MQLLEPIRRHLGVSIPVAILNGGAVLLASGGEIDALTVLLLVAVVALTLLVPVAISRLNRKWLRGTTAPTLAPGEVLLHDGSTRRYEAGWLGWMFLTDRRLMLHRLGDPRPDWEVDLSQVRFARVGRYAGVVASDLLVDLKDGSTVRLQTEAPDEWARLLGGAGG